MLLGSMEANTRTLKPSKVVLGNGDETANFIVRLPNYFLNHVNLQL